MTCTACTSILSFLLSSFPFPFLFFYQFNECIYREGLHELLLDCISIRNDTLVAGCLHTSIAVGVKVALTLKLALILASTLALREYVHTYSIINIIVILFLTNLRGWI